MKALTIGTFYGVGVGPGDPELLTRKAERILREVNAIYYPIGAMSGTSFSRRILEAFPLPAEKFHAVSLCMSRNRAADQSVYERTTTLLREELYQGRSAAWITEGDPLLYSTFIHLFEELRRRDPAIPIEIVPGVTSIQAAAAWAQLPLAQLDERTAIVPAVYGMDELPALLDQFATVVLVKVHSVFPQLRERLAALPPGVRAVYLEKVGTPEARMTEDLHALREADLSYFSLVLLRRETASARKETSQP